MNQIYHQALLSKARMKIHTWFLKKYGLRAADDLKHMIRAVPAIQVKSLFEDELYEN